MNSNGPAAALPPWRSEAVAGGTGEHRGVGFEAQTQPVLGDQPGGERVVGHDQLFTRLIHPGSATTPAGASLAGPAGQLARPPCG